MTTTSSQEQAGGAAPDSGGAVSTLDAAITAIDEQMAAGEPAWPRGSADLYAHVVRGIREKRAEEANAADQGEGRD